MKTEYDDRLKDIREEVAGLSARQVIEIATVPDPVGSLVAHALDSYENEIIRLREANARLRTKNRNYRTGIKQLQRAHEASLHREAAQRQTIEHLAKGGAVCQIIDDGMYAPVRFNNEQYATANVEYP